MTETSTTPSAPSSRGLSSMNSLDQGQARAGPFMLTLCTFAGPVSIRPPQSPGLRCYTFFTTSSQRDDGGEQVCLHMGYFETLSEAQRLLQAVRRRFPQAIASRAPVDAPPPTPQALHPSETVPGAPVRQSFAPVAGEALTDTGVMKILETRRAGTPRSDGEESGSAQIGLLRPEDTSTRRALKEAVVEGAQVFFAVQLDWSPRPIDPGRVPSLQIVKTHTLYATESVRQGRCSYFLRLGFFADAAAAKEAASEVRSRFASAVIVPVTEQEIARARETSPETLGFAHGLFPLDQLDRSRAERPAPKPKAVAERARRRFNDTETLEQTLETLAAQEKWNDADSLNESGVRHLRVQVLDGKSGGS